MVNLALEPGLIGEEGRFTRLKPHVVLSCGLCEPSRYGLEPLLLQASVPVFFIVTVAVKLAPELTVPGTLLLATDESLTAVLVAIAVEIKPEVVPWKVSRSTLPEMPEMRPELLPCQKFQTPDPQTAQLLQTLHGVPV